MISWDDIIKQIDAEMPSLSAAQRCHHAIIAAIKAHLLQPGARVVEIRIMSALAVSRTPCARLWRCCARKACSNLMVIT